MLDNFLKMKEKILNGAFIGVILLIVILLFTIVDHSIHGLENSWSVPDYYFRNKIPYGFLWGVVTLFFTYKIENIWLKAMILASIIAITLQTKYLIEGYPLGFVLLFLLIHFAILYPLSICMLLVSNKLKGSK